MKRGKPLHDCAPGELAHLATLLPMRWLAHDQCRVNCNLFDDSDDEPHLWRAWRAARALGDLTPECLALLLPRLDAFAVKALDGNTARANQRAARAAILVYYYHLTATDRDGERVTKARANQIVAAAHRTTPANVKQLVLKHEGRGQRGATKKPKA